MNLLGYDIGSSSIKGTIIDASTGKVITSSFYPKREMKITAKRPGWAEQAPEMWWENLVHVTSALRSKAGSSFKNIAAVGVSYQMHGLVCVDKNLKALRPSIIWCDSRAVEYGERAGKKIGEKKSLKHHLNLPGNFTAAKFAWVKKNEPSIYKKIFKIMLPGDYIAMRLGCSPATSDSGLSEGIFWDYEKNGVSDLIIEALNLDKRMLSDYAPCFSVRGEVSAEASKLLGLPKGAKISYRAGDQPNNALSLNVLEPGELAATAGTSGVVYGVSDKPSYDPASRVNTFIHVNNGPKNPRYGTLMCLNGTGILNSWMKKNTASNITYPEMNRLAASVPAGSDGLFIHPYGNGAERTLENIYPGASISGLSLTTHTTAHLLRASQEGIAYALNYGVEIMKDMGIKVKSVRAGNANMFLSPVFREIFASVTGATVELYDTDGSQGAARGAGIGAGIYKTAKEAFKGLKVLKTIEPDKRMVKIYKKEYEKWKEMLLQKIERD